jgi:hypothetical protein
MLGRATEAGLQGFPRAGIHIGENITVPPAPTFQEKMHASPNAGCQGRRLATAAPGCASTFPLFQGILLREFSSAAGKFFGDWHLN